MPPEIRTIAATPLLAEHLRISADQQHQVVYAVVQAGERHAYDLMLLVGADPQKFRKERRGGDDSDFRGHRDA